MKSYQAAQVIAPFINRQNINAFRRLPETGRFMLARFIASDAGSPGDWRLAYNMLLEISD